MSDSAEIVMEIKNLDVSFKSETETVHAIRGVDLVLRRGETIALVGESGSGKSVTMKAVMGILPPTAVINNGEIILYDTIDGKQKKTDILKETESKIRKEIRGKKIAMVFQDPMTSLNPVMTAGDQIREVILTHDPGLSKKEGREKAEDMLEMVGINASRYDDYPHQFSGGMKQRVVIAIALACNPTLLIADEPTTALDVTIQAQVLEMIHDLKEKNNTAMLLITHDLGVVAQNCDRVAIIYAGEIVEYGTLRQVYKNILHPYTEGLFGSVPSLDTTSKRLNAIDGMMPDPTQLPKGCKFADRCKFAEKRCLENEPELIERADGHKVRCFRYEQEG